MSERKILEVLKDINFPLKEFNFEPSLMSW